jgi:hypothetical protein
MRRYLPDETEPDEDGPVESRFDIGVPHGGVWSRDDKRVPPVLLCREHGLSIAEH